MHALLLLASLFSLTPDLLTDVNRNSPTMMGGWGPHLRSLLTTSTGDEWFAAETGADVLHNTTMAYYRKNNLGWKMVGTVALHDGIQQNMASLSDGRFIYSYGVNPKHHWVMECWFDTLNPGFGQSTCNAIALNTPEGANYVGAAIRADGTRVVWWTVSNALAGGRFFYTYNHGGGWNGPVESGLGGYNDVGYVHANFDARGHLRLLGELYLGVYPTGTYQAAIALMVLGQNVGWRILDGALSPTDLWHDQSSGTTHVLAAEKGGVGYYAVERTAWPDPGPRLHFFKNAYRMRFAAGGDRLWLVRDSAREDRIHLYELEASSLAHPIEWAGTFSTSVERPAGSERHHLSAIWTVDPAKNRVPSSSRLRFAVCGSSPDLDHLIWAY